MIVVIGEKRHSASAQVGCSAVLVFTCVRLMLFPCVFRLFLLFYWMFFMRGFCGRELVVRGMHRFRLFVLVVMPRWW